MTRDGSAAETAPATVVSLRDGAATVRLDTWTACPRCAAGRGCGAAFQVASDGTRLVNIPLLPAQVLRVGDRVELTIAADRLLRAAWLAYGVPLAAMVAAVVAVAAIGGLASPGPGDGEALLAAAAGLAAGGWWARRRLQRRGCPQRFVPAVGPRGRESGAPGETPAA